jgi:3',5'-cyclic AMP phosphodiesterase CpdA/tetratricopeptide (TPR) repeat protein
MSQGRLFFIMPFGVRSIGGQGESQDFDALYTELLRPLAVDEDWEPLRVDEVVSPGTVTTQAMKQLFTADLVVADISVPNGNVYYELGVRQAISPTGTILIALDGTSLPFDVANQRVLFYQASYRQDGRFQAAYRIALREAARGRTGVSPVRHALETLGMVAPNPATDPVNFERELALKVGRATSPDQLIAVWNWAKRFHPLPTSELLSLAARFADHSDYASALEVLTRAVGSSSADYELHRLRGFYMRQLGDFDSAVHEFQTALELNPEDPETLGMLGGLYKRQGRYSDALKCYDKGAALSPSNLYMLVNQAAMAILMTPMSPQMGRDRYRSLLDKVNRAPQFSEDPWASLVCAEAHFAEGDEVRFRAKISAAVRQGARPQDLRSVADQLSLLGAVGFRAPLATRLQTLLRGLSDDDHAMPVVADRVAPGKIAINARSKLIVHLSDPHFGTAERSGQVVEMHRFFDGENSSRLSIELGQEISRFAELGGYRPEDIALVVSGDLTYTASGREFRLVESFLNELCHTLRVSRRQVVLVPGNHDVDWKLAAIDVSHRFDNFLSFARSFYGDELFRERYPLVGWDFEVSSERPKANQIVYFGCHPGLVFVGLNSCVFETNQDHYGFVGLKQLDNVATLLVGVPEADVRVAVMHHHLHPFPEALDVREGSNVWLDLSTVRDAGLVEQRLEQMNFDLVLHGHKHKPQLRETLVKHRADDTRSSERTLIVSGAGSVGVNSRELEQSESNQFTFIEMLMPVREAGAEFLRVEWRELSYIPGARWATQRRWVLKG